MKAARETYARFSEQRAERERTRDRVPPSDWPAGVPSIAVEVRRVPNGWMLSDVVGPDSGGYGATGGNSVQLASVGLSTHSIEWRQLGGEWRRLEP